MIYKRVQLNVFAFRFYTWIAHKPCFLYVLYMINLAHGNFDTSHLLHIFIRGSSFIFWNHSFEFKSVLMHFFL